MDLVILTMTDYSKMDNEKLYNHIVSHYPIESTEYVIFNPLTFIAGFIVEYKIHEQKGRSNLMLKLVNYYMFNYKTSKFSLSFYSCIFEYLSLGMRIKLLYKNKKHFLIKKYIQELLYDILDKDIIALSKEEKIMLKKLKGLCNEEL